MSFGLFSSIVHYISSRRPDTTSLKGPTYEAGTRLQAASGVHHLIGNLWHVLVSEYLQSLEMPNCVLVSRIRWIRNSRNPYASIWRDTRMLSLCVGFFSFHLLLSYHFLKERSQKYEHALREKSQVIRDTEMRSMNKKERSKRSQFYISRVSDILFLYQTFKVSVKLSLCSSVKWMSLMI